jgi:nucleotide-binding universal stress UspA family protein
MSAVDGGRKGTVVVGVDGSAASRHALAFAADEARRHGALLRIVGVDDTTEDAWLIAHGGPGYLYQERRDAFESMAREAVRETLPEAADSDAVTVEIVAGSPAERWSARRRTRTCWSSAPAVTAASPACCSGR